MVLLLSNIGEHFFFYCLILGWFQILCLFYFILWILVSFKELYQQFFSSRSGTLRVFVLSFIIHDIIVNNTHDNQWYYHNNSSSQIPYGNASLAILFTSWSPSSVNSQTKLARSSLPPVSEHSFFTDYRKYLYFIKRPDPAFLLFQYSMELLMDEHESSYACCILHWSLSV